MSKIFLSCASAEFGHLRDMLAGDLRRPNVEVKSHDEVAAFNSGETTLEKLDTYIAGCDAVVHLVGQGTGSAVERGEVDAILRRHPDLPDTVTELQPLLAAGAPWPGSYTQWEAYLLLYYIRRGENKRLYLYRSIKNATAKKGFTANDDSRQLQVEHWQRLEKLGRDRNDFSSREDLRVQMLNHLLELVSRRSEPLYAEPSNLWKLQTKPDSVFEGRDEVLAYLDAVWADALAEKPERARIVSLVAIGGAGKTTVASRWKDALLARDGNGGVERYFDWSFYSQGTRGGADSGTVRTAADATVFVVAALKFFGDEKMADSPAPPWDKGAALAKLVARHRTLLILDGLEPLQHPPGPQTGELQDDAIRALFAGLQTAGRGLCLVTTRERIADLAATESTTTPRWLLDHLTDTAGAAVLRGHGVAGPGEELRSASREVKGHALTLSLMGRYLKLAFDPPDIAKRDCFHFSEADAETTNGHAFRVFAAYERWLESEGRVVELAILRLLGLFDRPATPDCLAALCAKPLPGLNDPLIGLGETQWTAALNRLRDLDLIEATDWTPVKVTGYDDAIAQRAMAAGQKNQAFDLGPPHPFENRQSKITNRKSLDAHPLLREYFAAQLKQRGLAQTAHNRLYEHLCASVPYWPEGRDGLLPVYQAVAHGCQAERFQEVCDDVYCNRIQRGTAGSHAFYSRDKLGLLGLDLAAVACFFVEPWSRLAAELTPDAQAWLLSEAAFRLRALNRLAEAREPFRATIDLYEKQENWEATAITAGNLSELELTLGDVPAAEATAAQSVTFADRSKDAFQPMNQRGKQANAVHQAGQLAASRTLFAEAEALQAEWQPGYPLFYSQRGYQYCDLLLAAAERAAWQASLNPKSQISNDKFAEDLADIEHRATQTLAWVTPHHWLLDIALDHLTLGRVQLLRAVLESPAGHLPGARTALDTALATLRQAGQAIYLPRALLPSAWLHALAGEWEMAVQRLDEAFALATRGGNPDNAWQGGMRLYLIDTLLYRVRLFGIRNLECGVGSEEGVYPWPGRTPQRDLDEAATLITACGYHRRDQELADAQAALTANSQ